MPARISAAIPHGQNKNVRCGRSSEPRPPGQTAEQSQRRSLVPQIFRLAPPGRVPPLTVTPTGLLIFDPETVHFTPRLFPNEPRPPVPDVAGDIYPLDFVVESVVHRLCSLMDQAALERDVPKLLA
jgi:hypothetical protein